MTEIHFSCDKCGVEIATDAEHVGAMVECPSCSNPVLVPAAGVAPGMTIGGYEIVEKLGAGAMGEVWLARQTAMDRQVALKILAPGLAGRAEFVEDFLREARSAGQLQHPNIAGAFDAGVENGFHYLATCYIDGEDLDGKLSREGRIGEKEALKIALGAAEALKYAWDKFKIIHRDIKPGNIMIDRDGDPKIMDLGISKSLVEDDELMMSGVIVGTPFYISPEQAKAEDDVDFHTDIYSLGATLYHMLTGEEPYSAPTIMGIMTKHITEPTPDPRVKVGNISAGCADLIQNMMAKSPAHRQSDWGKVIDDIESVIAGGKPSPTNRPRRRAALPDAKTATQQLLKKHKRPDHAAFRKPNINSIPAAAKEPPPRNNKAWIISGAVVLAVAVAAAVMIGVKKAEDAEKAAKKAAAEAEARRYEESRRAEKLRQERTEAERHRRLWDNAVRRADENAADFAKATAGFNAIAGDESLPGEMRDKARAEISKLADGREKAIEKVLSELKVKAEKAADDDSPGKAVKMLMAYNGPFAAATRREREELALPYEEEQAEIDGRTGDAEERAARAAYEAARKKRQNMLDALVIPLAAGKFKTALNNYDKGGFKKTHPALGKALRQLVGCKNPVAEGFKEEIGRGEIPVETVNGIEMMVVKKVENGKVFREIKLDSGAVIMQPLKMSRLSLAEKVKRMSGMDKTAKAIYFGVKALKKGDGIRAREYFSQAGSLAGALMRTAGGTTEPEELVSNEIAPARSSETAAAPSRVDPGDKALKILLRRIGVVGDPSKLAATLGGRRFSQAKINEMMEVIDQFESKHPNLPGDTVAVLRQGLADNFISLILKEVGYRKRKVDADSVRAALKKKPSAKVVEKIKPLLKEYKRIFGDINHESLSVIAETVGLPVSFTNIADIGEATPKGSMNFSDGAYLLRGAGTGVYESADQCLFVYDKAKGDFELSVLLESIEPGGNGPEAGIMIRDSLAAQAKMLFFGPRADGGGPGLAIRFQEGELSQSIPGTPGGDPPVWLKITRHGNRITCSSSKDGGKWREVFSNDIEFLGDKVLIGMVVMSMEDKCRKAVFKQVRRQL